MVNFDKLSPFDLFIRFRTAEDFYDCFFTNFLLSYLILDLELKTSLF